MLASLALALATVLNCAPIQGASQLWEKPTTHYILVGEIHGTAEIPAFFGDLTCAAYSSGRPIVVAIEAAETEQGAIDRYVASDGEEAARKAFLESAIWTSPIKDGRSSRAYFDLFERLRTYKQAGRIADVVAIQPVGNIELMQSGTGFNSAMAERFRLAGLRRPNALVLGLVGNVHAAKSPLSFDQESLIPAAAALPPNETFSLNVTSGGEAWSCIGPDCGAHHWQSDAAPSQRAVSLGPRALPNYDGTIDLGVRSTASPPVAP
jgi:hypothetical protein